ncbi:MAG: SPOR domain-containing protein [Sulfuritalea sp.]|nr:SPOR domain-containing protein [Sulfuritalea sp.]
MAEKDTSPDADLQLKKRARRRLVGAAALALFAVIVLPMVMDREPHSPIQDIQVRIPSQDSTGFAAKVLPGNPAATPMPAPAAAPGTVAEPVAEPKAAVTAKPEPAAVASAANIAADAKLATDASGQWVVQLGAYKEAGNVKLLLAKLKGVGVPAYTEKLDLPQGPRTRVRAGPFASQDAAEKARTRIRIIGVDGKVGPK